MASPQTNGKGGLIPSVALVCGGAMWGVFWIPIRAFEPHDITGAWPGFLVYLLLAVLVIPLLLIRLPKLSDSITGLLWAGVFTGTAFSLYSIALFYTDVVRVLLLFYLTPLWGTLFGYWLLGEKITARRIVALLFGAVGLLVILGLGTRFPWPENLGDWLSLISGIAWAYGSLHLYRLDNVGVVDQISVFVLGGAVVSGLAIVIGGTTLGNTPSIDMMFEAKWVMAAAALVMVPMLVLTLWPSSVLSPGRVGILLMSEVVVGVVSAAILTDETFGFRELLGACLIVGAGVIEVLPTKGDSVADT